MCISRRKFFSAASVAALTVVGLAVLPQAAQAQRISGVTATSTFTSFLPFSQALDGTGLSALTLTATHAATNGSNCWIASGSSGVITFDLGGLYDVSGFSFWNQNGGGPGPGLAGIKDVAVLFSTDGSSFFSAAGTPTQFAKVTGINVAPEIFSFTPVTASHVRFSVASNWGAGATGFAEVGFKGTASTPSSVTPELPGAMQLLPALLPVALIGARKRFKKA